MDQKHIQGKVQAFAQRLLEEAQGDPVRALGLLVLVLDGSELAHADHANRLVSEVRKVLMPEQCEIPTRVIRHLAGEVSWEGVQHCLKCAAVLSCTSGKQAGGLTPGYVFQIGNRFSAEDHDDFDPCL
jgi:hypothetical protein